MKKKEDYKLRKWDHIIAIIYFVILGVMIIIAKLSASGFF
jgi:hypothetical protein